MEWTALLILAFASLLLHLSGARPTKTYRQVLPPIPGYIPVYIQDGDVPPDVESIYEIASTLLQAPPRPDSDSDSPADVVVPAQIYEKSDIDDNNNSDNESDDDSSLKESEEFIMHQLTDNSPTADNEVEAAGAVIQELNDNDGSPGQVVEISSNDSGAYNGADA